MGRQACIVTCVFEAAQKSIGDALKHEATKELAINLRKLVRDVTNWDVNVEEAFVCREGHDGAPYSILGLNKVLFEAAKATQALLVARENAKDWIKRLIPDAD